MKNFKLIVLTILSLLSLHSCVKDDVENNATGDYIVGFRSTLGSYIFTDNDVDPVQVKEKINLIGGQNGTPSDEDIVIPFTIESSSTAIAGTDYILNTTGNSVTLAANTDFTELPFTVNPNVLPGNVPKTIVITLGSPLNSNATISEARKTITITIAKCESDLAGTYSLEVTREDNGEVYNFSNEIITQLSLGEYVTSTSGPYDDLTDDGAPRNGFIFKDVCQSVVIEEQYLGDYFSNLLEGDSNAGMVTLDPLTGEVVSITMNYSIRGFSSGVSRRYFTAVYTKL
jgi:hypothetical protein